VKIPHRFRAVKFRSSAPSYTSFAGLRFVFDLAMRLGLVRSLQAVSVKKRRRGIPIEDFVLSLAANFLVGGDSLTDLEVLRQEEATRRLCYDLQVPAPTTAGERLRTFSPGHVRQLGVILRGFTQEVLHRIRRFGPATVDVDSSIFQVHGYLKEGARYGYSGVRGLHPLLAFLHEERLLLGTRLRAGNRSSNDGVVSFLQEILRAIPPQRKIRLRMDAGFYDRQVEAFCVSRDLHFSISARLTSRLQKAIDRVPANRWHAYPFEEEAEWAEFSYQPHRWSRSYRLLVKRTPWYEKEQRILGEYFYTSLITNLPGQGSLLIRHHLARGGTENYIEEFKNGIGARHLPCRRFQANAAWLMIAALAYNLAQAFKLLLLPKRDHAQQLKKLRLHWFAVGARWIRTGRRWILALARGPDTAQAFHRLQQRLQTL
jgi:hypothetical protein